MLKKLDIYIIRKFLGAFLLSIVLILSITVVFDLSEKIDKLTEHAAPLKGIIFDYYVNLLPYYFNMLSPLFVFISVIFFTSKLAGNSEIISMQAAGMSFNRLLRPYFIAAGLIAAATFIFGSYIIPPANKTRLVFENQYIKKFKEKDVDNVQMEIKPGIILYIENFDSERKAGFHLSLEQYKGKTLTSRLTAENVTWTSENHWRLDQYVIRRFDGMHEHLMKGEHLDTVITVSPEDFFITSKESPQMTNQELRDYLDRQKERGVGNTQAFEDEYYHRYSTPFAAFILTLIGVSLSAKKVRGGTGANLGIGIALSAGYVLFSTFSSSFSASGDIPSVVAAWIPNFIFSIIAFVLYLKAPR